MDGLKKVKRVTLSAALGYHVDFILCIYPHLCVQLNTLSVYLGTRAVTVYQLQTPNCCLSVVRAFAQSPISLLI